MFFYKKELLTCCAPAVLSYQLLSSGWWQANLTIYMSNQMSNQS